jgi:ATP synthase protein I
VAGPDMPPPRRRVRRPSIGEQVGGKERRKLRARRGRERSIWFGLGTFGMIGWSVAIPTLAGLALGIWLDNRYPGPISWTLTLLVAGMMLGCANAWYWLSNEQRQIEAEEAADGPEPGETGHPEEDEVERERR